jgi:RNA polymerase sigma factor for flagellar operon FliA
VTVLRPEHDLMSQGLEVVQAVARRLARRLGGHVQQDDLAGIGNLALIELTRSYDPARATFAAYATSRVRWAILDVVRRDTHARSMAARAAAILAADRFAEAQASHPEPEGPTTLEEDQAALAGFLSGHAAALAMGLCTSAPDPSTIPTPEEAVGQAELAHVVRGVVGTLPERERALIERHYFGGEPFDEIAQDLGISKSWASRLHERAILAVKRAVDGAGPADGDAVPEADP